jgi:Tfp pilus assembly protein PilN
VTRVNLLRTAPVHGRKAESSPDRRCGALAGVILTLTSFGIGWWGLALHRDAAHVERELVRERGELARLRTAAGDASALERASQDIQERIDVLVRLRASQRAPVRVLDEIARAIPGDCWLTAVIEDGPGGVRVDGRAPALSSLFQLVERLESSSALRDVEVLDSRATADDSGTDLVGFSVKASLHTPGAGAGKPGVGPPPSAVADRQAPTERSR